VVQRFVAIRYWTLLTVVQVRNGEGSLLAAVVDRLTTKHFSMPIQALSIIEPVASSDLTMETKVHATRSDDGDDDDDDMTEILTSTLRHNQIPFGHDEMIGDTGSTLHGTAATTALDNIIAHKESQEVRRYKMMVFLIILGTSVVVAACVHCFIKRSERIQFEDHFKESAAIVLEGIGNSIARTLIPLDSLAVSIVSYARASNNTWPYVTLPNYALRMAKTMPLTDAMVIQTMPIIQPEQKAEWELYGSQHNQWVNESIKLQDSWDKYTGPIIYDWEPYDKIFSDYGIIESNIRYESGALKLARPMLSSLSHLHFCL
jgi:hypothetical protein